MAASRSSRVTRSTVGVNGLDENFYGRTLRTRSISHAEESSPVPQPRSQSPKKKECIQSQKGTNGTKTTELKQQNLRESVSTPRKRGLSISEKDNCDKSVEDNGEREEEESVLPVCKRVKLSPSEASALEDELPVKNESETVEGKSQSVDNGAESPGHKKARRCLVLDDCDKVEVKNETVSDVGICKSVFSQEEVDYQTVNGTDEGNATCGDSEGCLPIEDTKPNTDGSCTSSEQTDIKNGSSGGDCCSLSLNGSKVDSTSEPNVPCPNSQEGTTSVNRKAEDKCSSCETQSNNLMVTCAPQLSVSNSEGNVEGNSNCSKSQCTEGIVDNQSATSDDRSVCKESEPPAELDSAQVDSLSELQEYRYTLRTSPRRAGLNKDSPKTNSSPRADDQVEEQKLSPERNTSTDNTTELSEKTELISQTEKVVAGDFGEGSNNRITGQPSGSGPVSGGLPTAKEKESLQSQTAEEEEEDPDVYYFESDHLALKHNKDYQRLLQTIGVLESQRIQAVQDLEYLSIQAGDALKDPIRFVEQLQKKIHLGFPCPQRVVQLPDIAWEQYTSSLGNFERELKNKKRNTRGLKLIFDKGLSARPKSPLESKKDGEPSYYSLLPSSDSLESTSHSRPQMIRGRLYDETKPESFNQLWTIEEQKKLEQLLLKYPPEEVESRRWQKIADELGNRTARQVASRVQKYFIKLTKAGIPVPGRTPNLYMYSKKSSSRKQHPLNKHLYRPSTFMTSYEPPVYMDEDDPSSFHDSNMDAAAEDEVSDEESIPAECRHLPEYKELLGLKKLKKQKLHQLKAASGFVQHVGFKCDSCGLEPILGVRWHCMDCPQNVSLDFCDACSDCLHETDIHKAHHQLEPVYRAETFLDRDYCVSQSTSYSYLDPNYYPANR
ncbi:ZZ-type zinc finger-containing protein 3 isoform X2 [Protopterus annectens]|uniref:ZZ-type zinc finger-containing protein 3 isoform X2 n=1 Tax=Protopterus annectens TaxID=7888 RepID=UPI001CFB4BDE|nr:ZZ-type zinc finger-containing protein 3 isoform X2 [Protopterus annectens]